MGALTVCECAHPLNPFNPWLIHSGPMFMRDRVRDVRRMVELERQCCRFLNFDLTENAKTIRLDVSGEPEALVIVEDLFG